MERILQTEQQPTIALSTMYDTSNHQMSFKRTFVEHDRDDPSDQSAVRRRISRACDQCNQQRSKCDGRHPCAHCLENQIQCAYERAPKKRGRAPKKGHNQMGGLKDTDQYNEGDIENDGNLETGNVSNSHNLVAETSSSRLLPGPDLEMSGNILYPVQPQPTFHAGLNISSNAVPNGVGAGLSSQIPRADLMGNLEADAMSYGTGDLDMQGYGFPLGDDCSVAFMGRAPMVQSPDWLDLNTPLYTGEHQAVLARPLDTLRFPVLRALLPRLQTIISQEVACELLEQYFASSTAFRLWPRNPYILGYIFRKSSILHSTEPRPCSPALLACILWTSAQYVDIPFLNAQPDARAQTCKKLLELTLNLLKPLFAICGPAALGPLGHPGTTSADASLSGLFGQTDNVVDGLSSKIQVDIIVTYIHLATVVSASERKAASLRWWNAAWSLAREIRLGREVPSSIDTSNTVRQASQSHQVPLEGVPAPPAVAVSEEDREERRRAWWLLYMMDRHLALCYNRPMFFLNKECEQLLQPMDDNDWQAGRFEIVATSERPRGANIECTSLSSFGYFLPLMVILGEILDLNYARNRPRFGPRAQRPRDFSETIDEIEQQLVAYQQSLNALHNKKSIWSVASTPSTGPYELNEQQHRASEVTLQTKIVVAYSTHIMHVLYILLTGKWDPIALLDDNDLWITSQSFVNATGHAVSAAEALADIIEYDPDLSYMPFFFGIYLLQGSFLLLSFADKLQEGISPGVVRACETIVRAHEACVSTLDTQYQRNFRRVMRSALQQLRGRMHEDVSEQQKWRREILKLYRWTGDGTGLAL